MNTHAGHDNAAKAGRLQRWSSRPGFLVAALVLGLGLLFGAPLLARHVTPPAETESPAATSVAAEEAAGEATEAATGEAHGEEVSESEAGPDHPPTLVEIVADLIESSYRKSLSPAERAQYAAQLHHPPHEPQDYLSPVARALDLFEAPIFSLFIIVILSWLGIAGARNMTLIPGPLQNLVEMAVEGLDHFIRGVIGPQGGRFVPFLGTLFLYIYFQNMFGLIPFMFTPTSLLSTTFAMGIVVFFYVQWVGIRSNGVLGYLKHLAGEPKDAVSWAMTPLMLPLHIVGELAKPVSLSLRLFGNMMGEETLIAVFMGLGVAVLAMTHLPIGFPLHVPFVFLALLTTLIQALVFMLLSTVYFALVLPHEPEGEH